MRIPSTYSVPPPARDPGEARAMLVPVTQTPPENAPISAATKTDAVRPSATAERGRFSVLNDFRYLTDSDKAMLGDVTGEKVEPGFTDRPGASSAFALQLALDRRTGNLAPNQQVTGVYLRNAAANLDKANAGRAGYTNPYSGEIMDKALSWLDAHGRGRADIRL